MGRRVQYADGELDKGSRYYFELKRHVEELRRENAQLHLELTQSKEELDHVNSAMDSMKADGGASEPSSSWGNTP